MTRGSCPTPAPPRRRVGVRGEKINVWGDYGDSAAWRLREIAGFAVTVHLTLLAFLDLRSICWMHAFIDVNAIFPFRNRILPLQIQPKSRGIAEIAAKPQRCVSRYRTPAICVQLGNSHILPADACSFAMRGCLDEQHPI